MSEKEKRVCPSKTKDYISGYNKKYYEKRYDEIRFHRKRKRVRDKIDKYFENNNI